MHIYITGYRTLKWFYKVQQQIKDEIIFRFKALHIYQDDGFFTTITHTNSLKLFILSLLSNLNARLLLVMVFIPLELVQLPLIIIEPS